MAAMPPEPLALGLRFHPTEEELVGHYLKRKISGKIRPELEIIPVVDIYKHEPWDLPDKSLIRSDDNEWFFFAQKDRKYVNGHRSNRSTKTGYWKTTGRDRIIRSKAPAAPGVIGMMKILVFHQGRAPRGVHTNWIMHEYRATQPDFGSGEQGGYVLCRLFRKTEEKNGRCNGDETQGVCFSSIPNSAPGDTQHEGDDLEVVAPVMAKAVQVPSVSDLHEDWKSQSDTVEHQSLEGNHEDKKEENTVCDHKSPTLLTIIAAKHSANDILAIPTSGGNLAPAAKAARVLTASQTYASEASVEYANETVVEDSSSKSRISVYPLCGAFKFSDGNSHPGKLKNEGKMTVMPPEMLPLGFRFHPTDEELVNHYLKRKLNGQIQEVDVIPELDVCKCEPWDLPYKSPIGLEASAWFFFSSKDKKYPTGNRSNRATMAGYWKVSGRDRPVRSKAPAEPTVIGMKKSLIFYRGRAPKGVHTNWVMHEYRSTEPEFEYIEQANLVIFRLFRKANEKDQSCNGDEMERSGSSSSPTKSSPGDTEHGGEAIEEPDAPINQVSTVSDLQEEQESLCNTIENQPLGVNTHHADKAEFSSLKSEGSFSKNPVVVDLDSDRKVKAGESLVSRCLSSLFTSATRGVSSSYITGVSSPMNVVATFGNRSAPIASAAPAMFLSDQTSASVSSMASTSQTTVDDSTMVSRNIVHPLSIDPSFRICQSSYHAEDNEESHSSSSRDNCDKDMHFHITDISAQAASCNTQSSSGEQSTDSSHITVHLTRLRSLFSKPLSELTLELLMEGAESAKIVSSTSGMHENLAKHLQSVIHQAHVLHANLDRQNDLIAVESKPIYELEQLEADMPKLTARLESLKLDIDHQTVALLLHRRLQLGGEEENLAELRDELAWFSSAVASKECQINKLRSEKSRHELSIGLARDRIKKLEDDFNALADPFRNCFLPAN